ncbi:MAG: protein kinase [Proteobacteria bacterium]|nr:protein kinase [Pseudomonadota bacterium]
MSNPLDTTGQITLLQELSNGPGTLLFVGQQEGAFGADLVALKVLRTRTPRDLETLVRVRDKQRILGSLRHRHIVCHHDLTQIGGHLALVAPFVDGVDLLEWVEVLRETGVPMPPRVVCEVLSATGAALNAALTRVPFGTDGPLDMVHRDLKPMNLMVDRDGELKVLDFGSGFTSLAGRKSRSGALKKGLIRYISPTRRSGKRAISGDDIYALGIIGVEMFRGRWLRRLRTNNPAHDRHLAEVVANLGQHQIRGRRATEADSKHRFPVLESRPTEPGGPGDNREVEGGDLPPGGLLLPARAEHNRSHPYMLVLALDIPNDFFISKARIIELEFIEVMIAFNQERMAFFFHQVIAEVVTLDIFNSVEFVQRQDFFHIGDGYIDLFRVWGAIPVITSNRNNSQNSRQNRFIEHTVSKRSSTHCDCNWHAKITSRQYGQSNLQTT